MSGAAGPDLPPPDPLCLWKVVAGGTTVRELRENVRGPAASDTKCCLH